MALINIDLQEELQQHGAFVAIRDPRLLPWGITKKLAPKDNSQEAQFAMMETMIVELVRKGNITVYDDNDNATALTFPVTASDVDRIPDVVLTAVATKFAELRGKGSELPKQ